MDQRNDHSGKQIYFIITRRCNYSCSFCIRQNLEQQKLDMSLSDAKQVLRNIHKYAPKSVIVMTGGEPLFHRECEDFIKFALSLYDRVILTTNGSFAKDKADMLLPYLRGRLWLQFSLDGPKSIHDSIRGLGAYDKVIKNLQYLEEVSGHLLISSTIGYNNIDYIADLARELNNFRFARWKMTMEIVKDPLNEHPIDNRTWNNLIDRVLPLCRFHVLAQKYYDFDLMDKFLKIYDPLKMQLITNCGSGKSTFVINPDFSVVPCTCMNEIVGNFLIDDTLDLLNKLASYCQMSPDPSSICFTCKYKSICNGGCSGYSKKCFGKFNMGDLRCPFIKQSIAK